MRTRIRTLIAAGAIALIGATALSATANADHRRWGWNGPGGGGYGQNDGWDRPCGMRGRYGMRGHRGMRGGRGMRSGWGMRGGGGPRLERLLERFDTDKDGRLTQAELDDARKTLLAKHDADKDGKLTIAEFEALWLEFSRPRMVRNFQGLDRDGDAGVTVEEFLRPYADTVERMDRNGDGTVSRDDRRGRGGWRGRW